jgi:anti-sigma factor RsiW
MSDTSQAARFERDHRWAPGQMSAYVDGDLPEALRTRLEHHLGECAECRRLLAGLERMIDRLGRLAAPSGGLPPREIAAAVRVRLDQPPAP